MVVVVVPALPEVSAPVVVDVAGGDEPFVVVGAVPVDPAAGVVVVVVLHTPRRCASGPHVDVVVVPDAVSSAAPAD